MRDEEKNAIKEADGKSLSALRKEGARRGEEIAAGTEDGIKAQSNKVSGAVRSVLSGALEAGKRFLGIHSPSRVMRDEVGKQIVAGIVSGIDENGRLAGDAMESVNDGMLDSEKRYLFEKGRLEDSERAREESVHALEYQKRLAAAKDETTAEIIRRKEALRQKKLADDEYLKELEAYAEAEKRVMERLKEDIGQIYQDIAEYARAELSDVIKAQEKLENKLSDYGSLTTTYVFRDMGPHGEDVEYSVLADLDPQIQKLTTYADAIERVRRRIIDSGFSENTARQFFGVLSDLSIEEGTELAQMLENAGEDAFSDYLSKWEKKQLLSEQLSKRLYQDEFYEAVDDVRDYMERELEQAGLTIPDGFFVSGSLSADNFGSAFIEELEKQMEKVRKLTESFAISFPLQGTADVGRAAVYNNTTTYNLTASGESVREQLEAIDAAETRNRLRGR